MSTKHYWNNNDSEKRMYSEESLTHCHSVHHKYHTNLPRIYHGLSTRTAEKYVEEMGNCYT